MNETVVSVIIPAFNAERFLAEAIESALSQDHPTKEVIAVDDGSEDGTVAIARSFPDVRLIPMSHGGVSAARNQGVEASSGEFLAFLDADDLWHRSKLRRQLELYEAQPGVGLVVARQEYRFEGPIPSWFRGPVDGSSEPGYMPSNWLMPVATWDRVGGFAAGVTHSEDTDWLARARDLGIEVAMVDEVLVVHRIHDRNASGAALAVREGVLRALRGSVQRKQAAR